MLASSRGEALAVILGAILLILALGSIFGSKESKSQAREGLVGCLGQAVLIQVALGVIAALIVLVATCSGR